MLGDNYDLTAAGASTSETLISAPSADFDPAWEPGLCYRRHMHANVLQARSPEGFEPMPPQFQALGIDKSWSVLKPIAATQQMFAAG